MRIEKGNIHIKTTTLTSMFADFSPGFRFVFAVGVGLFMASVLALLSGVSPVDFLVTLWTGSWGDRNAACVTLAKATPLILTGLAVSLAYRVNLLNIGCEGQLTVGALAGATFAHAAGGLPAFILAPLTVLVGGAAGALWALPAVWLRRKRGVHEVVSTLLLNTVAVRLCEYLAYGPLGDGSAMGRTAEIPAGAMWPHLIGLGTTGVTFAPVVALLGIVLFQVWLMETRSGFEVRAVGSNLQAAETRGLPAGKILFIVFASSGALAGLAGALEVVAVHHRFYSSFSPGYGFDGVTAAFLAGGVPGRLWLSGLLIASLRASDKLFQLTLGISPSAVLVIQAVLLMAAASRARWISTLFRKAANVLLRGTGGKAAGEERKEAG